MKKIVTAINNPRINNILKQEKNIEIIGKDIQYKEGILEVLENNINIDYIIINIILPGEITIKNLIEKINIINKKINIILIIKDKKQEINIGLEKYKIEKVYTEEEIYYKLNVTLQSDEILREETSIHKSKINTKSILLTATAKIKKEELAVWICRYTKNKNASILLVTSNREQKLIEEIKKEEKNANMKKNRNNKLDILEIYKNQKDREKEIFKINRVYDIIIIYKNIEKINFKNEKTNKIIILMKSDILDIKQIYEKQINRNRFNIKIIKCKKRNISNKIINKII